MPVIEGNDAETLADPLHEAAPSDADAAAPDAPEGNRLSAATRMTHKAGLLLPGLAVVGAITLVATFLGGLLPVVGAPVFAIVFGIVLAVVRPPSAALKPGLAFSSRQVLQGSIIILGLELSLRQVVSTGTDSLPVLLGTLGAALGMAWLVGRALKLRSDLNLLIGVGTAICGASAIAATDAVIDADEADVSYAIATIFTFNVIAVLAYPSIGHLLGLGQHSFGLWAGTAINDTSSVVAASNIYGPVATSYGVVVKLTRTLAIIPICIGVALWRTRRVAGGTRKRPQLRRVFPLFIVGFIGAVLVNTVGLIPAHWHHGLSDVAAWMITAALAAIGLSTKPRNIRSAGPRPILLGAILWATVGLVSLGLQAATGTL
ncbi:MAG: YeiH family protein [Acidimicrobiales bacterium]